MFCEVWGSRSGHCLFQHHPCLHKQSWVNQAHMHICGFYQPFPCLSQKSCLKMFAGWNILSLMFDLILETEKKFQLQLEGLAPLFQPLLPPEDLINTTWVWLVFCRGCQRNNHILIAYSASGSSCVLLSFSCSASHFNSLALWPLSLTFLLFCPSASYSCMEFSVLWLGFWSQFVSRCLPCIPFLLPSFELALLLRLIGLYIQL